MQCTSERSYVGFAPRFIAYIIDLVCVFFIGLCVSGISTFFEVFGMGDVVNKGILFQYSIIAIITYIIKKMYFVIFTTFSGQTLGKMCFRIKVVNDDGSKVTFWNALYRETIGRYLTELIVFLGYAGLFVDREKRAIHDMICDTRVIYDSNINNEPIYQRRVYSPINAPQNIQSTNANVIGQPNIKQQLDGNNNIQANMMQQVDDNNNVQTNMTQQADTNNGQTSMMQQECNDNNIQSDIQQINNDSIQDIQYKDNIEEVLQDVKSDNDNEKVSENQIEIEDFNCLEEENTNDIKEETVEIDINSDEKIINEKIGDNSEPRREINKDIASAYGSDLDYSTEFIIDEDDSGVSYDTTELDELLEKLNGKQDDK